MVSHLKTEFRKESPYLVLLKPEMPLLARFRHSLQDFTLSII